MPGRVVGVPGLRLESQEHRDPFLLIRKVNQQTAVLEDAIVLDELADVALVHVDVVDAVARQEAEVLVLDGRFGPPALAERVDERGFVG